MFWKQTYHIIKVKQEAEGCRYGHSEEDQLLEAHVVIDGEAFLPQVLLSGAAFK